MGGRQRVARQELEKKDGWEAEGDLPLSGTIRRKILVFLFWFLICFISFKAVILIPLQDAPLEVAIPSQNFQESCILCVFFSTLPEF